MATGPCRGGGHVALELTLGRLEHPFNLWALIEDLHIYVLTDTGELLVHGDDLVLEVLAEASGAGPSRCARSRLQAAPALGP